jgi:hypothetical protein
VTVIDLTHLSIRARARGLPDLVDDLHAAGRGPMVRSCTRAIPGVVNVKAMDRLFIVESPYLPEVI